MASPPYRSPATSPPYPSHTSLPNPKKRPSLNMPGGPSNKRQKRASINSAASAHPLRQTSFPPEESAINASERSPSVDSDFTIVTGGRSVVTAGNSKRVRGKGKAKKVEGSVKSLGREKTADGAMRGGSEVPDDEDDEDEGAVVDDGKVVDEAAEREKLKVLIDAFNPDQYERFESMRRIKLKKETVRKITNQTVSQSVPPAVVTIVGGYTKTFMGILIERAREVQRQWASLETPPHTPPKVPIDPTDFKVENPDNDIFNAEGGGSAFADLTRAAQDIAEPVAQPAPPTNLGPLLPDHFREALRRYKRDGEGGGTGLAGVSVGIGVPGVGAARLGGKRLFR
ncbi:hypothetical protein OEA41_003584 [Lepraria neglecta]|uniref:TAFII28-like protein domain-containing protein n=1 Tax=Lepraria neglecta TaxID=209136 RepID=A0AAD9Z4L1_9LECA|nr:hypothetical protein OEA41_003584 [Lepraria neglecta]